MKKLILFVFIASGILGFNTKLKAQTATIPNDFCISAEEYQLYKLINEYRKSFALPDIVLSKSLSYVAKAHVQDLVTNYNANSKCNMHSWSDKGLWTPICFPSEQSKKNNVWLKAQEIVGYSSEAHEITYWSNAENSPLQILSFWRKNEASRNLLVNQGKWEDVSWKAIGIGIKDGYAVVWFGQAIDIEESTSVCGSSIQVLNSSVSKDKASRTKNNSSKSPDYYIVIANFNNRGEAIDAVENYKASGYPKAILIESDGKIRVAIDYFMNKKQADKAAKQYEQKFEGAWVLTL